MDIGRYRITVVKKQKPARLEKKTSSKEQIEQYLQQNERKLNIIIIILMIILFIMVCFMLVPQTYGYLHW